MESTTTRSGAVSATALCTAVTSVPDRMRRLGGTGPRRSARRRTWWADSSAETRRARCPAAARATSTCKSSVDLPIPGSPPSKVTEPGTRPPESTRSNSSTPVGTAAASATSTEARGTGMAPRSRSPTARSSEPSRASSTRVFHSPHVGHRPTHRAEMEPQSRQRCRLAVLAIPCMLRRGCVRKREGGDVCPFGDLAAGQPVGASHGFLFGSSAPSAVPAYYGHSVSSDCVRPRSLLANAMAVLTFSTLRHLVDPSDPEIDSSG